VFINQWGRRQAKPDGIQQTVYSMRETGESIQGMPGPKKQADHTCMLIVCAFITLLARALFNGVLQIRQQGRHVDIRQAEAVGTHFARAQQGGTSSGGVFKLAGLAPWQLTQLLSYTAAPLLATFQRTVDQALRAPLSRKRPVLHLIAGVAVDGQAFFSAASFHDRGMPVSASAFIIGTGGALPVLKRGTFLAIMRDGRLHVFRG
jgi:hypothetical protein